MAQSIKVCCRFRKEYVDDPASYDNWEFSNDGLEVKLGERKFTYDHVLDAETEQDQMYEFVGLSTIEQFCNGYNGTIFAYGQSGSGKTFSMLGPEDVTEALSVDINSVPEKIQKLYGVTPRAIIQIFQAINNYVSQGAECTLHCSYIEVYNETIKCLLSKKENLKIREIPNVGMSVTDRENRVCKTPEEIFECIALATRNRAVSGTNQNARSSRSHTVLMIDLDYVGLDGVKRSSKLNLVDLAGSERIAKTGASGDTLKEAQKINQSLTTLGMCIMALTTPGSKHIPFRNSKLTLLLKESLGGNAMTTLLCTASRKSSHTEESLQTLYFAARAKTIQNQVKKNVTLGVKELQYLADNMKCEILKLRGQLKGAGLAYNLITDPKILTYISNDEFEGYSNISESSKEDPRNRRLSLINLSEEQIIYKYCELRAKFDNLLESAGNKILQLSGDKNNMENYAQITSDKLNEIHSNHQKEIEDLVQRHNVDMEENQKVIKSLKDNINSLENDINGLKQQIDNSKSEYEALNDMLQINQTDINEMQEKIHKKKKKNLKLKEDYKIISELNKLNEDKISSLNNQLSEKENENSSLKLQNLEISNKYNVLLLEFENLKKLNENNEISKNEENSLNKELKKQIEDYSKKVTESLKENNELKSKNSELEIVLENTKTSLRTFEENSNTTNKYLQSENDRLNKLISEQIEDKKTFMEKEKILEETKNTMESRLNELTNENLSLRTENENKIKNYFEETASLNNLTNELKIEINNKKIEIEEKNSIIQELKNTLEEQFNIEKEKNIKLSEINQENLEKIKNYEENKTELNEKIKSLESNNYNLDKSIKEITTDRDFLKSTLERKEENIKKLESENLELKESLKLQEKELKTNEENLESKLNALNSDLNAIKTTLDDKNKELRDAELKINELKGQISVLQSMNKELERKNKTIEFEKLKMKEETNSKIKEGESIKGNKVEVKTNIFGVNLIKSGNKFLKEAIQQDKESKKKADTLFKLDELKALRQNIISLSPKTISSRGSLADIPELNFMDEESFLKAEMILIEKEKEHIEKKKESILMMD